MLSRERVFLRAIEPEDLHYIQSWRNDIAALKYLWPGVPNPTSMDKLKMWVDEVQGNSSEKYLLICTVADQKPIGVIGISDIDYRSRKGDLSIMIGEEANCGQGYGTEALILFLGYVFRVLNLTRVALEVYEYNERAIKAYEKVGFKKEGYVRRSIFRDGQYWGEYIMAIFKDDYFASYPFERSY